MNYLPQAKRLLDAIIGKSIDRVPNFEVFFENNQIVKHFIGKEIERIEDELDFCLKIGWGSLSTGFCWAYDFGYNIEQSSDGSSHYKAGAEITRDAFDKLVMPDIAKIVELHCKKAKIAHEAGLATHYFVGHCFHVIATNLGLENFSILCCDDFELVLHMMEKVEEFNRLLLKKLVDSGEKPDFIIFDADCAFKNGMMVNPSMYRQLTSLATVKTLQLLKDNNIPYVFHTDGDVREVYPVFIEWGVSATHGVEAAANNLLDIKERYGDEITLIGNFDPVFISNASPQEVKRAAKEMVAIGKKGGRYIAGLNTIVKDYVPVENYLAFLEAIDEEGKMI